MEIVRSLKIIGKAAFFVWVFLLTSCADILVHDQVNLNHGVIDLSNYDLKTDGPLRIEGKAHFVWKEFVSKEDFKRSKKDIISKSVLVPFRKQWRHIHKIKKFQERPGSGYGKPRGERRRTDFSGTKSKGGRVEGRGKSRKKRKSNYSNKLFYRKV